MQKRQSPGRLRGRNPPGRIRSRIKSFTEAFGTTIKQTKQQPMTTQKILFRNGLLTAAVLLLCAACKGDEPNDTPAPPPTPAQPTAETVVLSVGKLRMMKGSTAGIEALSIRYDDGSTTAIGSVGVTWKSADPAVAAVSAEGEVTAVAQGQTTVTATASGVSGSAEVIVKAGESTTGLDAPFTAANIYTMGQYLKNNSVIQGFDILPDGGIYYMQIAGNNPHRLSVIAAQPNKSGFSDLYGDVMSFDYFGHGTNYAIEQASDGLYVWLGCYASKTPATGQYWNNQTIARVKFEAGKTVKPQTCNTQFYMGPFKELHPAIDVENDVLAINYPTANPTGPRRFRMYRLSDAMALPLSKVTLQSLTYGGGAADDPQTTVSPEIYVRDLRQLTPLGEFGIPNQSQAPTPGDVSFYAWQGFDVNDGLIYYSEGEGKNDGTPSAAYVTIYDFAGTIIESRTEVRAASDMDALAELGITASGYMEAEGIKVRNGKLFVGFASRDSKTDGSKRRANILVYNKVK